MSGARNDRGGLAGEAVAVWSLLLAGALAVLVTYWRLPAAELYRTSVEGAAGGAGRALVFLNFPGGVVAIALLPVVTDVLLPRRRRLVRALAPLALALCAIVLIPGVVDIDDLDARPVNALPAVGVALVLVLTVVAARTGGLAWRRDARGDRLRVVLTGFLAVLAVPWLFAEWGFYAPDPLLADEVPSGETLAAVHLGHHHGTDGVLLAVAALALSRSLGFFRSRRLEAIASVYLALMLAYGVTNAVEDVWLEQVVKRGWTDRAIPNVLRPELEPTWAAVIAGAAAVELVWFRPARRRAAGTASTYAVTSSSHSDIGT